MDRLDFNRSAFREVYFLTFPVVPPHRKATERRNGTIEAERSAPNGTAERRAERSAERLTDKSGGCILGKSVVKSRLVS